LPCDEYEKFYDSNTEYELSHSQIAQALHISKGTVSNYLTQAEGAGITHSVAVGHTARSWRQ